jgi:hypothetical protein
VSLADHDSVHAADPASDATPAASRAAAVAKLVAAVQKTPGDVIVIGKDAQAAAGLFDEAEAYLATYRGIRVRGRALDGDAAVAALCADKEPSVGPGAGQRAAMQALVDEARAVALPVVVVVAEADKVGADRLERFRQAVECVTGAAEVVRIVFLGGPRLMKIVRRHEARSLGTRVAAVVRVPGATVAPQRKALGRLPAGRAGRWAGAVALGGGVVLAAWMLAPRIVPPRTHVAGPPPTSPVPEPPATRPPAPAAVTSPPRPAPRPARGPVLQVGAFLSAASAETLSQRLAPQFDDVYVSTIDRSGSTYHRVRLGGFASEADLRAAETALRKAGYAPVRARD